MIRPGGFISLPFAAPPSRAGGGGGGGGCVLSHGQGRFCDPKSILEMLLTDERVVFAVFTSPPRTHSLLSIWFCPGGHVSGSDCTA